LKYRIDHGEEGNERKKCQQEDWTEEKQAFFLLCVDVTCTCADMFDWSVFNMVSVLRAWGEVLVT